MSAVDEQTGSVARPETRPYAEVRRGYTYFAEGDVLFAKITPCMQNGKHAIATNLLGGIGFGSTEFHVIRPSPEIESGWIYMFLRQPSVLKAATAHFTGSVGQQRVPAGFLAALTLPLPPISEQNRLVRLLAEQMAAVEQARTAINTQLQTALELSASYLLEVFEGAEARIWPRKHVAELCERRIGTVDPRRSADQDFVYIDISAVDNVAKRIVSPTRMRGAVAPSRARQVVHTGDVIVATTRPNLNAVALVPPDLDGQVCSTGFCVLRAKIGLVPEYLFAFVRTNEFVDALSELVRGALYPAVTDAQVRAIRMPLAPEVDQRRISALLASQLAAVERARAAAFAQLREIDELPASLLRQAFVGEM